MPYKMEVTMRLSTSTCIHEHILWDYATMYYSSEQSITACAKAGFEVLDFNFASYSRQTLPMTQPDWEDWVKRQKELSDSLHLEYTQSHAHFYCWNSNLPYTNDWDEELIRRSIIGAGILNAKWLVIHPGNIQDENGYSYKKSLDFNIEQYKKYAELASKHHVGIAIENMIKPKDGNRFASSYEDLLTLMDQLNDPIFGLCWDTGHAHLVGINQCEALRAMGKHLKALHIADNRGVNDDHVAPYFGTIVWEPIIKTLKEMGYEGDFTYEIHNFTNGLPNGMHDQLIDFAYELGMFMLNL
jgi:sugar phosphate isomerase/epimerase